MKQVEQDNDERSTIPITIRCVVFFLSSQLRQLCLYQSTGGHHPHFRVAGKTHAVTRGSKPSCGRSDPSIQILYHGRRFRRLCGRAVTRCTQRGDEQDSKGDQAATAYWMEHKLSEPRPRIRDAAGVFKSCTGEDTVHPGEEGGHPVLRAEEGCPSVRVLVVARRWICSS